MRYRLELVLRSADGALQRAIGLVERRGFAPRAIEGAPDGADGCWRLRMTVESSRPPEPLRRLMQKNHDCLQVEITACP
ncbi:ACT domain-containing protein [Coralloluteibacterium thermophilus]|uniref:ACT domain-containing protein n=1 Tax=Coralloluteibacterium thermophilum TaxID=2707049 RepID=A0ABV9NG03_9GAMM